jgi:DNA-binding transcriptional MerR regulator
MANPENEDERLTVSQCAARTGVTVRALRVYERYGLVAPRRAGSGWRLYGRRELIRLNAIRVLKAAGLTLAQIRAAVGRSNPPLQTVLRAQIESWETKREQAERGRTIAEAVLQRLQAGDLLSVDELCELVRNNEPGQRPATRDLIARIWKMPAQEQRAWARRHNEDMRGSEAFREAVRTRVDPELEKLMDAGVPPSSRRVQRLVGLYLQLMLKHRVREETVRWLTQEPSADPGAGGDTAVQLRRRFVQHVLPRLKQRPTETSDLISNQWTSNPFLVGYFAEAEMQSAQCRDVDQMLRDAHAAERAAVGPRSANARALVKQFRTVCRRHSLGDPLAYAQWAALARPPPSDMTEAEDKALWGLIAESIRANSPGARDEAP